MEGTAAKVQHLGLPGPTSQYNTPALYESVCFKPFKGVSSRSMALPMLEAD
jgi:hypothetical protein